MRRIDILHRATADVEQASKLRDAARVFLAAIGDTEIRSNQFPFKGWDLKNMEDIVREWTDFDEEDFAKRVEQDVREDLL